MRFFHSLTEKSWEAQAGAVAQSQQGEVSPERIALRFFLATVSIIFFLFLITFISRTQFGDFIPLAGQPWQPFTDATQLWVNTGLLLAASLAMQWGVHTSAQQNFNYSYIAVVLALGLSVGFITAQLMVWRHLYALGFYVHSNPANSFYFLLTAIHGLHLLGGLLVLLRAASRLVINKSLSQLHRSLSLCASYWHFLFIVWLVLFFFLTAEAETYALIAALCGIS